MRRVSTPEFLSLQVPLLDVRSPGEYAHAHIPGAVSLPLFTDDERAKIGTAYKQRSQQDAIKIGLDAFGPNMRSMVEAVEKLGSKKVGVHCWRGGMRSGAVAWLLDLYGFEVTLLDGGYKAYRRWAIGHWADANLRLLCGNTGSGKTDVLCALRDAGAPVINLEALACHKGSAFGGLGQSAQPTQEMFENTLAHAIATARARHGNRPVWIEDESRRIGDLNLPNDFFLRFAQCPTVFINRPFEERLDRLTAEYGRHSTEGLLNAMVRIKKRLGPLETKTAIAHLIEGDVRESFRILLRYYDKHYYPNGLSGNNHTLDIAGMDAKAVAAKLNDLYS